MSRYPASAGFEPVTVGSAEALELQYNISSLWWLWLVTGIAWIGASFVVLQFDGASVKTVGIIVGAMFLAAGLQQIALAVVAESGRWAWAFFGALFVAAGVVCLLRPVDTFAGMADILGLIFLVVGVWWAIRAFLVKATDSLWWLGLVTAILMFMMAYWTSGAFYIQKAYTLLVLAGIWALMQGIADIVRAFQVRSLSRR